MQAAVQASMPVCCICNKKAQGQNNPWPVKHSGKCCDKCNAEVVILARLMLLADDSEASSNSF